MAISADQIFKSLDEAAKLWHNVELQIRELDSDYKKLEREFSELRIDHMRLQERISILEGHATV
jgi:hypothetical protein